MIQFRPLPCLTFSLCALLSSCCNNKPYPFLAKKETDLAASKIDDAPVETGALNIISSDLPDKAAKFLPVTEEIFAILKEVPEGEMKAYTETVPRSGDATIEMLPIPGGEFLIGSPSSEEGRSDDESPQRTIKIEPFWMASTEITWASYQSFMANDAKRNKDGTIDLDGNPLKSELPFQAIPKPDLLDAISQPTQPYQPMHDGMGDQAGYDAKFPALSMTQHAASKFCEWLTAQTGNYYRLPTEAEWEYACRAGTTTAYSFGDDVGQLSEYAWYRENSEYSYHPVGLKKPNPWGLFDMHGNVCEWTIDAYVKNYSQHPDGSTNPFALSPKRYPRVARGGDWDALPEMLRSAARNPSSQSWKNTDPQDPKSIWYHTDNWGLGFRIIRPAKNPSLEEMHLLWNTGPGERF